MQIWNLPEGEQIDRTEVEHVASLPHVEITAYQNHFQNQFYDGTTFHGRPTWTGRSIPVDINSERALDFIEANLAPWERARSRETSTTTSSSYSQSAASVSTVEETILEQLSHLTFDLECFIEAIIQTITHPYTLAVGLFTGLWKRVTTILRGEPLPEKEPLLRLEQLMVIAEGPEAPEGWQRFDIPVHQFDRLENFVERFGYLIRLNHQRVQAPATAQEPEETEYEWPHVVDLTSSFLGQIA